MLLRVNVYFPDILTVSETATEPPQDETGINAPRNLGLEATFVNHNFSQQVLKQVISFCDTGLFGRPTVVQLV